MHSSDDKQDKDKEKPLIKGNVDAELVLYAMKELPNYEQAIIVSGDGDFFSLAEYLKSRVGLRTLWRLNGNVRVF